nr:FecR domain-containing protein [uncultured Pseudomonas sp.]
MKDILAQAVEWYVRLHDSSVDQPTRAAWQAWCAADQRHAQAWARLEQLNQRLSSAPRDAVQTLEQARLDRRHALKALTLLLGVGAIGWQSYRVSPWSADYSTRVGQRQQVTLADGTRLQLNTDSRVDIHFDGRQRLIDLRQGEIMVETAKDPRPLRVRTAQGQVQALGTRFCVRQEAGVSQVAVTAHTVQVQPARSTQLTRVDAGQRLSFSADDAGLLQPLVVDADAWTRGMLVSVDWRLGELVAELARYRPGYLSCADQVAGLRLSGAFNLDDTDAALVSLEESLPVRVRRLSRYWVKVEALTAS